MLTDHTVAVIGAGNIGRALIGGLVRSESISRDRIVPPVARIRRSRS